MIKYLTFSIIFIVLLIMSCQNQPKNSKIADVGDWQITWTELNRSFNLEPHWQRGMSQEDAYRMQLEYLITTHFFAQEAKQQRLDTIRGVHEQLRFILEKEMLKELYRQRVAKQVKITDEELAQAYERSKKRFKLAYIECADSSRAIQIRNQAIVSGQFQRSLCKSDETFGQTDFLGFGELAPSIERVVYSLPVNEISQPIRVNGKYMLLKILDGRQQAFKSELDLKMHNSKIRKILFDRKAARFSHQFLYEVLHDQQVELVPEVFFPLAEIFESIVKSKKSETPFAIQVTDGELGQIHQNVNQILDKPVVVFRKGLFTVREFLEYLSRMPRGLRPKVKMKNQLKLAIAKMVRNTYLLEIAYKKNLQDNEVVRFESELQKRYLLANLFKARLRQTIDVSDNEINAFINSENFEKIRARFGKELKADLIKNLVIDYKFSNKMAVLSDSLKKELGLSVYDSELTQHLDSPSKILNGNPIGFTYVENFN